MNFLSARPPIAGFAEAEAGRPLERKPRILPRLLGMDERPRKTPDEGGRRPRKDQGKWAVEIEGGGARSTHGRDPRRSKG
jgi:hypothetical protein